VSVSKTDYDNYYRDIENDGGTEIEAQLIGSYDTDAHYFLGMSKGAMAKAESVNKSQITRSIQAALTRIETFLKKVL
jgi:hypothetical protein